MEEFEAQRLSDGALSLTRLIIDKFGPRLSGTKPCLDAADYIHAQLKETCDSAQKDTFYTHPEAFLRFMNWMNATYIIGLIFGWLNYQKMSCLFSVITLIILYSEYLFYHEVIDGFYPEKEGKNVYGVIEPSDEVKHTIIFSGHHDSAHIFNFYNQPKIYLVREVCFFIMTHLFGIFHIVYFVFTIYGKIDTSNNGNTLFHKATIFFTFGLIAIIPMLFFTNPKGTPGAGDNLTAVTMGIQLSKRYSMPQHRPKNTRLIFASYDSEESGLRGSRAFFARHKKDFDVKNTWNYNIDCSYYLENLKFLTADINGNVKLSREMSNKCVEIAHKLGYPQAYNCSIPFLTGGTDAAEAAKIGINATTCLAIPFETSRRVPPYHSMRDIPEAIEPAVLCAMMRIFVSFVETVEAGEMK